jgi:Uma2 family endonuclease
MTLTAASSTSHRWTTDDLYLFPEPLDDTRYEIVDGELFVTTQPTSQHQYSSGQVTAELIYWNRQAGLGIVLPAPGVIFSEDNNVAPDVVWLSTARYEALVDEGGHLQGAPELMVEVLSPGVTNERRDRVAKLSLYSRRGVSEYWILVGAHRQVEVYRRAAAAGGAADAVTGGVGPLQLVATLGATDVLTSPLLPGFSCPVARLFLPTGIGGTRAQR